MPRMWQARTLATWTWWLQQTNRKVAGRSRADQANEFHAEDLEKQNDNGIKCWRQALMGVEWAQRTLYVLATKARGSTIPSPRVPAFSGHLPCQDVRLAVTRVPGTAETTRTGARSGGKERTHGRAHGRTQEGTTTRITEAMLTSTKPLTHRWHHLGRALGRRAANPGQSPWP